MLNRHFEFWPKKLPTSLSIPKTTIQHNLEVTAARYPDKTAMNYYGNEISYRQFKEEVDLLAGYLQVALGVEKGDRVLLYMQNCPQYMIAFYAILRADAVVVPLNPMNMADELSFYIADSKAKIAIIGQELYNQIEPLTVISSLNQLLVATYSDYLPAKSAGYTVPYVVTLPRETYENRQVTHWVNALSGKYLPSSSKTYSEDLCILPYTSGTTGRPKGCMHTHHSVQANTVGAAWWMNFTPNAVILDTLPLFHVTGLIHSMNAPIYAGCTMVIMTRWERDTAAELVQRTGATHWTNIVTMVIDFLANPRIEKYDLSSLTFIGGGGAALPEAVGERLYELTGIRYVEGYGLSETISQTHFNPMDRPKMQCLGIPSFDVEAMIVDPLTKKELGPHEEGELLVHGQQLMKGYWNREEENQKAFVDINGKSFFCTGDIAKYDDEGYFFMVDRVKRMINASGFKVWPAEVESVLYKHPAVEHACVIGVPDDRRGETVKAYIVLKKDAEFNITDKEMIEWSKERMAAYKYPRKVEFVNTLPMSGSGKILWRSLQENELKRGESQ